MKFSKLVKKWQGSLDWWISVVPSTTFVYKGRAKDIPLTLYLTLADCKVIWCGDYGYDEYGEKVAISHFEIRLSKPENKD